MASAIVVTAHNLDAARTKVDAGLGATVYSLTNDTIENRPGGETGRVSDILTQAPGVTLAGRTLTIRGAPADQLRINDVIVPEAISDPADLMSSRLAETTRLITGTLPAQFGFAPAGVISITTKNGLYEHGGQAEFFAGSDQMIEPAFELTGSEGSTSVFASGELEHDRSRLGDIEGNLAAERRTALDGLGFADHILGKNDRISFILGGSSERRNIGETSIGPGTESKHEGFAVATYQHSDAGFTLQGSLFAGVAVEGNRFSDKSHERRESWGAQVDGSDTLGTDHRLRFGLLATRATARELEGAGGRSREARTSLSFYGQDEWRLAQQLTFNPGVRVEWLRGVASAAKIEPRMSLVWRSANGLAAHAGYARYQSAPPLGEAPAGTALPDERDDVFDAGLQKKAGALTLSADAYWRSAYNLIEEHQPLGSAVARAFEFGHARIRGLELSVTYARRGTTAWANLSSASLQGRMIVAFEDLFAPDVIAAASAHDVPLASDRPVTISGGFTHRVGRLSLGADVLLSSGAVRTLSSADPNGSRRSPYAVLGLSAVYHARIAGQPADLRFDVTNVTNSHYATSDAANLEGGWTRWGAARAIMIGLEQGF